MSLTRASTGILPDRIEEPAVEPVRPTGERRRKVEAEPVDVEFLDPVSQAESITSRRTAG